jgi:hypothetical protein
MKMSPSIWKEAATLCGYLFTPVLSALAIGFYDKAQAIDFAPLRDDICSKLSGGQFCVFSPTVISISQDWMYSGGLDKGMSPATTEWKTDILGGVTGSVRNVFNGNRFYNITDTSYQISFKGELPAASCLGLSCIATGSLLQFNDSSHTGESIPTEWRTAIGYQVPADSRVLKFSRDYGVNKTELKPGELGCPSGLDVVGCKYVKTYLAGGATGLGGLVEAIGDITANVFGREAITINTAYLRNLNLLIDNNIVATIGKNIGNAVTTLQLDDSNSGLKPTNLDLKGEVELGASKKNVEFKGSLGGDAKFTWESDKEFASIFATYNEQAFSNFVDAGADTKFTLSLSDTTSLLAGVDLFDATSAKVFSQLDLAGPESSAFTVFSVERVPVPAPLPILGLGAAFGYSRRLRKRIKASKTPEVKNVIG